MPDLPISNQSQNSHDQQPLSASQQALPKINRQLKEKAVAERAKTLNYGYIDIASTPINPDLLYLIAPDMAEKALVMVFFRIGNKLRLALAEPDNALTQQIIEDLKTKGYLVNLNLASDDGIKEALKLYQSKEYKVTTDVKNIINESEIQAFETEIKNLSELPKKLINMPSEEGLNLINIGATRTRASDIHFQPEAQEVLVRFRIDGLLQTIFRLDRHTYENLQNQIKFKAGLKLNVHNIPQDGRYFFVVNDQKIDVRVASIPTEFGEALSCRLLDTGRKTVTFAELGFSGVNLAKITKTQGLAHGLILVTGPTGSGKTTTLYTMLQTYNTPETKIVTLEDPIEYHLDNVTQSQINEKRNFTFATGLRAILRQDPDVIMIGEIRDLPTAETAAQAALTGHVVFSTLHTNSAVASIPRLLNIGLPPYIIAPALSGILAQRLVRRVCPDCATPEIISATERLELEKILAEITTVDSSSVVAIPEKLPKPTGCDKCSHTGYSGRLAIAEIILIDDEFRDLILNKASVKTLFDLARSKKMLTMKEDGILKVLAGVTTLEEVERVTRVV